MALTNSQCQKAFEEWNEAQEHILRRGKAIVAACQEAESDHNAPHRSAAEKTKAVRAALAKIKSQFKDYKRMIDTYRPNAYKARRECEAGGMSTAQFRALGETIDKVDAGLRNVNNWIGKVEKLK